MKRPDKNTQAYIDSLILAEYWFTADKAMDRPTLPQANINHVTIYIIVLVNGTKLVGVNEGPVDEQEFSPELGRKYAREKALEQIWPMLGYELRTIKNPKGIL